MTAREIFGRALMVGGAIAVGIAAGLSINWYVGGAFFALILVIAFQRR